ncbi:hypothetical protein BN137_1062 [Cronobacter condimenti 1330]|uniref:Uncharacterized protein n=1 Tax=Cronobacter condimenti 1330 TaxID=1073999 RepID=K8ABU1_9ENTR|nr:hypothetical protein BN137_1062 [Cronobacter condimenti 1330]
MAACASEIIPARPYPLTRACMISDYAGGVVFDSAGFIPSALSLPTQ